MSKRVSLDWNSPLLPAVTKRLLANVNSGIVDLSDTMVIVPTKQAGRRLLEALALAVSKQGRGLFPPEIITPDRLLANDIATDTLASEESSTAAWFSALSTIDFAHFKALFPIEPTTSTGWKMGIAQRLMQLRNELGEEGLDFTTAAERACEAGHEPERWRQLARLEGLTIDELKQRGLIDPKQARREAAYSYEAPSHIKTIILAATPDPQPLPLKAVERASTKISVEVWTYGPGEHFDDWGRPLTEVWQTRPLDFEAWGCHLQTLADPKATATSISQLIQTAEPESALLGIADPELNPVVTDELLVQDIASYDPEGRSVQDGAVGRLTELLCQLCNDQSTATIRSLLQHPDIEHWLDSHDAPSELLRKLDKLFEKHLAADLQSLIHFSGYDNEYYAELHLALKAIVKLARELSSQSPFAESLANVLQTIYTNRKIESKGTVGIPWKEQAEAIQGILKACSETEHTFRNLPSDFSREAFRSNLKRTKVYPDRPRNAHDILGWLELLWNDAPHLILAGLNEGKVPESVIGDAFLPETLREALDLRTNAMRFARDAYLLEALCRRRANQAGRIDLLVPQTAADTTPLRPSRILFLGGAETLLPRTRQLFREIEQANTHLEYNLAWKLSPPSDLPIPEYISVSALKSYLQCPFRFFLRYILKMRTLDVKSRELTPAGFGTLFHDTLSHLRGQTIDSQTTEASLVKELHTVADNTMKHRYGKRLSFALRLQREALMARINAFCQHQIEDVKSNESIHIIETEEPFEFKVDGFTIRGTIDRIDQRGDRIELIDYKTADTPKTPQKAHLATVPKKGALEHLPEEAFFEHDGKNYYWTDLQLPLYLLSKKQSGKERPTAAYINLAKTVDKSGIARWDDLTDNHITSAEACTVAIIRKIKAGEFWPPNPDIRAEYDDFAPLFPDGIENSVDIETFKHYTFRKENP